MSQRRKLTERTLYSPLGGYAKSKGFDSVQEIGWDGVTGTLDLLIQLDEVKYVVEVKMGRRSRRHKVMIDGLVQSYGYATKEDSANIAVIVYDERFRDERIDGSKDVETISLHANASVVVLSEYWWAQEEMTGKEFFDRLWTCLNEKREVEKSVKVAVAFLSVLAREFAKKLREYFVTAHDYRKLAEKIGHSYDAFFSLSNVKQTEKSKTEMNLAIVDLLACVILCQIIFYVTYQRTNRDLPELPRNPKHVKDFSKCFDKIKEIDYEPIYDIEALGEIPPATEDMLDILGNTVRLLEPLRPDEIEHDLLGQLFSSIMPARSRKVLAGFYSLPPASDILARLAIRDYRKTIWDPACGSGTILVSAYKTMRDYYKSIVGSSSRDLKAMHRSFVERQITGNDIMAFACILSGLNLASRDVSARTHTVRIFKEDSLGLLRLMRSGKKVRSATSLVSEGIAAHPRKQKVVEDDYERQKMKKPSFETDKDQEGFSLEQVDVVLTNPPFTVRTNLDTKTLKELKTLDFATRRCGHDIDLWGYFLALSIDLVRDGGTIGAIVSTGFLSGKHTQKIRDYYLDNLSVKFMIKPTGKAVLSGNSKFKDMILVCEKRQALLAETTVVVLLKESVEGVPEPNTNLLVKEIERLAVDGGGETDQIEVKCLKRKELLDNRTNLLPLFTPKCVEKAIDEVMAIIGSNEKVSVLRDWSFKYGIYLHKNYSKALYVQRKLKNRPLRNRIMEFDTITDQKVKVSIGKGKLKGRHTEVPIDHFDQGLLTATGMIHFNVGNDFDLIVKTPFDLMEDIAAEYSVNIDPSMIRSEVGPDSNKARLAVVDRLNFASENSHSVAFYSEKPIFVSNALHPIHTSSDVEARILCLSLNSSTSILQICRLKSESQMDWSHSRREDWLQTKQLDPKKLTSKDKERLLALFEEISTQPATSLKEQFESMSDTRVRLDREILAIMGISPKRIDKILPVLYEAISTMISPMEEKTCG